MTITSAAAIAAATSGEKVKPLAPLGVTDEAKELENEDASKEGAPKDPLVEASPGQLDKALPATRLLEKRRMVAQVQEALDNQKLDFIQKEEILKKREDTLRSKDLLLQESLIGFSKFLQENGVKKKRAEKKEADEIRLRNDKEVEIAHLERTLVSLKHEKSATHANLEHMMFYHKYLETVIDTSEGFSEINDLLMRHATLQATNDDLKQHVENCGEEMEMIRESLQAYVKASSNEILNLDNDISVKKLLFERKKRETGAKQLHMDSILLAAATKTLARSQICMAAENLFQRICKLSHISHFPYDDPLKQLDCVGDYISDLSYIIKQHKQIILKKEHDAQKEREKAMEANISFQRK
ncbi:unnamed protein product [Calypogeia fissa]